MKEVLENDPGAYFVHDELLAPLKVMYNSLQESGDDSIANGRLLDAMRQVPLCSRWIGCNLGNTATSLFNWQHYSKPQGMTPCRLHLREVAFKPFQ